MKQIASLIFILGSFMMLGICCGGGGDDSSTPNVQTQDANSQAQKPTVQKPQIIESSIGCDYKQNIIYFNAVYPSGTKIQVLLYPQGEEDKKELREVSYRAVSKLYTVDIHDLTPGSSYIYCVIGYDSNNKEVYRSPEMTLTMPKNPAPKAPSVYGILTHAPTTLSGSDGYMEGEKITLDMEYSTDNGETWTAVTEAGFIRNLRSGKVLLRLMETATTEAGLTAEITIPEHKSNTDTDGDKGSSEGLKSRKR